MNSRYLFFKSLFPKYVNNIETTKMFELDSIPVLARTMKN